MDFQIRGDVEEFPITLLTSGKVQQYTVPDLMRQDEQAFILRQFCIKVNVHEDVVTVGAGSGQTVVTDGNQFHPHDDAADEWPAKQELLVVLGKLLQADLFAPFFGRIRFSYGYLLHFRSIRKRDAFSSPCHGFPPIPCSPCGRTGEKQPHWRPPARNHS